MASRMASADFVQMNGLGFLFHSLLHLRMSAFSSVTLRWADLRSFRFVSSAGQVLGGEPGSYESLPREPAVP